MLPIPLPFLANLSHAPADVSWFLPSHSRHSSGERNVRIGKSALVVTPAPRPLRVRARSSPTCRAPAPRRPGRSPDPLERGGEIALGSPQSIHAGHDTGGLVLLRGAVLVT